MLTDSSEGLNKETEEAVYFFSPAFDALNNFSAYTVRIWGRLFPTAEHAYQWKKFEATAPEVAEAVFAAGSPNEAQGTARMHKEKLPEDWHGKKVAIMEEIMRAKAEQHEDVREVLRRSGARRIVENSPVDSFWGAGPDGKGKNMVGEVWMKVRKEITGN